MYMNIYKHYIYIYIHKYISICTNVYLFIHKYIKAHVHQLLTYLWNRYQPLALKMTVSKPHHHSWRLQ